MVTLLLLVSRDEFLDEVYNSIETLDCDPARVSLLCIIDGDKNLFIKTRNLFERSKFDQRLCIQHKTKRKLRQFDIAGRRHRIATLHNLAKEHINTEYVFGVEDDTIVPRNALETLLRHMKKHPTAGIIEGVEMGRWGVPYIGAWKADNVDEPTEIISMPIQEGLQEIDAGGFYCFITRSEFYTAHNFKPFDGNGLGPDTDYSISLRRMGLMNYADFSLHCIHKHKVKDITFENTTPRIVRMFKNHGQWRQNIQA